MVTPCRSASPSTPGSRSSRRRPASASGCRSSPLAAHRRRGRARGLGAEVQAPRCPGRAGPGEAAGAVETASNDRLLVAVAVLAAAGLAWGLFEAQWVELLERMRARPWFRRTRRPADLHLSDFHLGTVDFSGRTCGGRSPGGRAGSRSRRRHRRPRQPPPRVAQLERELARLGPSVRTVLGNHDVASTRDPFSRPADLSGVAAACRARSRVRGT